MKSWMKELAVGQAVTVEESDNGCSLRRPIAGEPHHTITCIEQECITLEAETTGTKLHLPIYLVKHGDAVAGGETEVI